LQEPVISYTAEGAIMALMALIMNTLMVLERTGLPRAALEGIIGSAAEACRDHPDSRHAESGLQVVTQVREALAAARADLLEKRGRPQ